MNFENPPENQIERQERLYKQMEEALKKLVDEGKVDEEWDGDIETATETLYSILVENDFDNPDQFLEDNIS